MLHKVSSTKMLHSQNAQNWDSQQRKDLVSPKHINSNISEKIIQLVKIIDLEKQNREKDFNTLNEKIKNMKCKHPVLIQDKNKAVSVSKQMKNSHKHGHSNSEIIIENTNKQLQDAIQVLSKQFKELQSKVNRIQNNVEASIKINQQVQQKMLNLKKEQTILINEQISEIRAQCEEISVKSFKLQQSILDKVKQIVENSTKKNTVDSSLSSKYAEMQESLLQSIRQVSERNSKQVSMLGQIVDKNFDSMYHDLNEEFVSQIKSLNTKIEQKYSLHFSEYDLKIQSALKQIQRKSEQFETILTQKLENKTLMNTQQSISNHQNSSIQLISDHQIQQKQIDTQKILQVISENCTYLQSRNIQIEESMTELVSVINNLLGKFKLRI